MLTEADLLVDNGIHTFTVGIAALVKCVMTMVLFHLCKTMVLNSLCSLRTGRPYNRRLDFRQCRHLAAASCCL